jgi:hypothetical protein
MLIVIVVSDELSHANLSTGWDKILPYNSGNSGKDFSERELVACE